MSTKLSNKKLATRPANERGMSLIETLLVVALAGVVGVSSLIAINKQRESSRADEAAETLAMVARGVAGFAVVSMDYTPLAASPRAVLSPDLFDEAGGLRGSPWGEVRVLTNSGAKPNDSYSVVFDGVKAYGCAKLVGKAHESYARVRVNGAEVWALGQPTPDAGALVAACSANANRLEFQSLSMMGSLPPEPPALPPALPPAPGPAPTPTPTPVAPPVGAPVGAPSGGSIPGFRPPEDISLSPPRGGGSEDEQYWDVMPPSPAPTQNPEDEALPPTPAPSPTPTPTATPAPTPTATPTPTPTPTATPTPAPTPTGGVGGIIGPPISAPAPPAPGPAPRTYYAPSGWNYQYIFYGADGRSMSPWQNLQVMNPNAAQADADAQSQVASQAAGSGAATYDVVSAGPECPSGTSQSIADDGMSWRDPVSCE